MCILPRHLRYTRTCSRSNEYHRNIHASEKTGAYLAFHWRHLVHALAFMATRLALGAMCVWLTECGSQLFCETRCRRCNSRGKSSTMAARCDERERHLIVVQRRVISALQVCGPGFEISDNQSISTCTVSRRKPSRRRLLPRRRSRTPQTIGGGGAGKASSVDRRSSTYSQHIAESECQEHGLPVLGETEEAEFSPYLCLNLHVSPRFFLSMIQRLPRYIIMDRGYYFSRCSR